jgi:hypothetical protein
MSYLSKFTLNGWKTQVGWLLTILPVLAPQFLGSAEALIMSVGQVLLAIGVAHKTIKQLRK